MEQREIGFDGGTLLVPIKKLVTIIGDAVMAGIQSIIMQDLGWVTFFVTPESQDGDYWDDLGDDHVAYPGYLFLTPESIFSNKISVLNPNFITEIKDYTKYDDEDTYQSSIKTLRESISKWYVGLRNLSLVGLLSVLVYVGIRIIISSTASEKAKYKQMVSYWLSAIVLLFMLHYIMEFTFIITEKITEIISSSNKTTVINTIQVGPSKKFTISDSTTQGEFQTFINNKYGSSVAGEIYDGSNVTGVANLMQFSRLYSNLTAGRSMTYAIIYIALVAYTVYFFIVYTKRVLYVAFLTLIAPLITLTYPIDKLSDGQAQAFNVWLKEFVFNVLIQPFHLLIYTIFVSSAVSFAYKNPIYAIVAIGFILPAEKLLRKMFGFDKASTSSAFSGAAAGSMIASAITKAGSKVGGSGKKGGSGDKGESDNTDTSEKTATKDPYSTYEEDEEKSGEEKPNKDNNTNENEKDDSDVPDLNPEEGEGNNPTGDENNSTGDENNSTGDENNSTGDENNSTGDDKNNPTGDENNSTGDDKNNPTGDDKNNPTGDDKNNPKDKKKKDKSEEETSIGERLKGGVVATGGKIGRKIGNATGIRKSHFNRIKSARQLKDKKERRREIAKATGRLAWDGFKTMTPKLLKAGTKYTLGGAAGIIAGGAALISGNPKSVLSAAALASKGGMSFGGNVADKAVSGISGVSNTFMKGYYGKDYGKVQKEKENREFLNDQKNIDAFRQKYGKNYADAMQQALVMRNDYGTTNNKEIFKGLDLTSEYGGKAPEEAVELKDALSIPAISKTIPDDVFDDREKYDKHLNNIQKRFIGKGMEKTKAREQAEKCLKDVAKYKGKTIPASNAEVNENNENADTDLTPVTPNRKPSGSGGKK